MSKYFEYCECGCHSHTTRQGLPDFSVYNPLGGRKLQLRSGHGCFGTLIKKIDNFDEADAYVRAAAKKEIEKMKKALR